MNLYREQGWDWLSVKLTIQYMGGDIWIDKDYKGGARFIFSHPIKEKGINRKNEKKIG